MNIKDLPWGMIRKIAGAALVASGLIGTGYVAKDTMKPSAEPACFKPTIYIDKQEVKRK